MKFESLKGFQCWMLLLQVTPSNKTWVAPGDVAKTSLDVAFTTSG